MELTYREANITDLPQLKALALKAWSPFREELTPANWQRLYDSLSDDRTYTDLLNQSICIICTNSDDICGMAFLVLSGHPTEIYDKDWSYIRFVSVDPDLGGRGIGTVLTKKCIKLAKQKGEKIVALHTSEMMKKASRIYETMGFKILREIDSRLGKRYWLYTLDIGN